MENEDRDIVSLLVRLQLEDLALLAASSKGKSVLGNLTDAELAAELYCQELEHLSQVSADRQLVLSHEAAIRTDREYLETYAAREEAESRDREAARNLSRGIPLPVPPTSGPRASSSGAGAATPSALASNASASAPSPSIKSPGTLPPPPPYTSVSTPAAKALSQHTHSHPASTSTSQQVRGPTDRIECVICTERIESRKAVTVPCGHNYCRECLKDLFVQSTTNERLMPPSCDRQPIPLALAQRFLTPAQVTMFEAKKLEFSTANRLYCYQPKCSRFLGPASATKRAVVCTDCTSKTCQACKSPWHGFERACAADTDEVAFAALSKELGCQRCPGCRRIVQLDTGCFHM